MLKNATDAYISAQSSGLTTGFTTFTASNISYAENEQPMSITKGVLTQSMKIDHNRSFYDTTACSTFTELIVTNPAKPYVIGTRMLFTGHKISTIESIVTTTGDWAFNATG
jgi:Na+-translocating ferredoxin:NAD+ oxidoreductase RnfG subunit